MYKLSTGRTARRKYSKGRVKLGFVLLVLAVVALLGLGAWTWGALNWSYSEGERAGVLQKFSKRGWMCKTYEGELALYVVGGVAPQIWYFSTRDEAVAQKLFAAVGQKVQVHYKEHRGIPSSCFADTPYFAESFTIFKDPAQ